MAHSDYECCSVCDQKQGCDGFASKHKGEICAKCVANLNLCGVIIRNVDELIQWIQETDVGEVQRILCLVRFRRCHYDNPVDEAVVAKGLQFVDDKSYPVNQRYMAGCANYSLGDDDAVTESQAESIIFTLDSGKEVELTQDDIRRIAEEHHWPYEWQVATQLKQELHEAKARIAEAENLYNSHTAVVKLLREILDEHKEGDLYSLVMALAKHNRELKDESGILKFDRAACEMTAAELARHRRHFTKIKACIVDLKVALQPLVTLDEVLQDGDTLYRNGVHLGKSDVRRATELLDLAGELIDGT